MKDDAKAVGLNFDKYEPGMTGGKRVALVVNPNLDYHWYVFDEKSASWFNKNGQAIATDKPLLSLYSLQYGDSSIQNYVDAANMLGYSVDIGEFYITRKDGGCFE